MAPKSQKRLAEEAELLKKIEKLDRIRKETNRLKRIFKGLEKDAMSSVLSLINNAAFMSVTLEDLQKTINEEGAVSEYQNGENQWGTKKSPEVEIYNTMVKNQMAIIRQLTDLLPKGIEKPKDDGFDAFVSDRDD